MPTPELEQLEAGHYRLVGDVLFTTVAMLADRPLHDVGGRCRIKIDSVGRADSSLLALLLRWIRREKSRGVELVITGLSPQLRSLIDLYDLEPVFESSAIREVRTA